PRERRCPRVPGRWGVAGPIEELLRQFANVELTDVRSSIVRGDVVQLVYVDQNRRMECQTHFMAPILPQDVEFVLDADAFVCVPITDYQVSQPTLRFIRQRSSGFI